MERPPYSFRKPLCSSILHQWAKSFKKKVEMEGKRQWWSKLGANVPYNDQNASPALAFWLGSTFFMFFNISAQTFLFTKFWLVIYLWIRLIFIAWSYSYYFTWYLYAKRLLNLFDKWRWWIFALVIYWCPTGSEGVIWFLGDSRRWFDPPCWVHWTTSWES